MVLAITMMATMCISASAAQAEAEAVDCPSVAYVDAPAEENWAHEGIDFVLSNGLMQGNGDGTFAPEAQLTRGMLAQILYRMEGEPTASGESTFTDVADTAWYANAVTWASGNDLVLGYGDGTFGPNDPITREQLAVMLYRYRNTMYFYEKENADLSTFADSDQVSDWAEEAMSWAVGQGLIQGMEQNGGLALNASGFATRAQVAAIVMRFENQKNWPGQTDPLPDVVENYVEVNGGTNSASYALTDEDADALRELFSDSSWEEGDFVEHIPTYVVNLDGTKYLIAVSQGKPVYFGYSYSDGSGTNSGKIAADDTLISEIISICAAYAPAL